MEMTMTTDLKSATKSQVAAVQRHVEHDPDVNHENIQIVPEDTELNTYHRLYDDDEVLQQHYGKWIDDRNAKNEEDFKNGKITAERYVERKQTVQQFISGSNGSQPKKVMTNIVVTPGSLETLPELYDLMGLNWKMVRVAKGTKDEHDRPTVVGDADREKLKQFYDSYGLALAKSLNKSQDGMVITTVATNLDEGGAPHIHMGAVNTGISDKTGKPVASLNAAILTTLPKDLWQWTTRHNKRTGEDDKVPSNKANLAAWRDVVDNGAMDVFNDELSKLGGFGGAGAPKHIDMVRLGDTGSVTMAQYKAQKALDAQREQQQRQQVALDKQTDELASEKNDLQKQKIAQQKQQKLLKMREREQAETMVDVIAHYEPTHKVRELGHDAQEVQTPDGREQHLQQSFKKIARMMMSVLSNVTNNVKNMAQSVVEGVDLAYVKQAASQEKYTTTPKQKDDGPDF